MSRSFLKTGSRPAFTLVELVVVLLIIGILASMTLSVVVNVQGRIAETETRVEISELGVALQAFMSDYGLTDPPPSKLVLYENVGLYATSIIPQAAQSYQFLQKVFGRNLGAKTTSNPTGYVGWNGLTPNPAGTDFWILEGEQCLVFYLGGIPVAGVPQGFSTNNMNPAFSGGKRKGPYFPFNPSRLVSLQTINPLATALSSFHPVYLDPWQVKSSKNAWVVGAVSGGGPMPYVYFSSSGTNNAYTYSQGATPTPGYSDCQYVWSTWVGGGPTWVNSPTCAVPYSIGTSYTNSNTYQIISAGKDGVFGFNYSLTSPAPGSAQVPNNTWLPSSGAVGAGLDDQANFSGTLLGKGQN